VLTDLVTPMIDRQQGRDHTSITEASPDMQVWGWAFAEGSELSPDFSRLFGIR